MVVGVLCPVTCCSGRLGRIMWYVVGHLARGGLHGGFVMFAYSMHAYRYMLLVVSWVMIAGGYTVLVMSVSFESSCYVRTTHPHNTMHCWAAWFA